MTAKSGHSCLALSKPSFRSGARLSPGYCWSSSFHATWLLLPCGILEIFRPSTKHVRSMICGIWGMTNSIRPLNRHYRPRAVARLKTVRKANIKITVRLPMVQKFLDGRAQGESLWLFLDVQGVEATHNIAERTHRFGVLWRQRSQGTRSEKGNRWVERVLSLRHTCRIRGHPTFPMLVEAVSCLFKGEVVFQMCTLPLYRLC
jgi:hypothetical protein